MARSTPDSAKIFRKEYFDIIMGIQNQQKQKGPGKWCIMNLTKLEVKLLSERYK